MTSNYRTDDPILGQIDLDDYFITDSWLVDQFVGNGLWAWGTNSTSQLGLGDLTHRSSPVQVGSLTNWKQVSYSDSGTAIKTDGTLWVWGHNNNGQLGLGDLTHRSSPVQVGSLTNWKQISGSFNRYYLSVKTDGTLWTWGNNNNGALGLGDVNARSSPTQVGSLTNWKQACAGSISLAIKTDGTLWSWGGNATGALGLGDTTNRSSPVQVGTLNNWKKLSDVTGVAVAVIKTDGTLWVWGQNNTVAGANYLGLGDRVHRSSPVQLGSLTNWKQISTGGNHTLAVKTDGTLWVWGYDQDGNTADTPFNHKSSPVQVGSLTNWKQVSSYSLTSFAIKTDGTLWTWGNNNNGTLGLGDVNARSSPTQVGSLTNWKQVSGPYAVTYSDI